MSSIVTLWASRTLALVAIGLATAGCTLLNDLGSYPVAPVSDAGASEDKPEKLSVVADLPGDGREDSPSDQAVEQVDAKETDAVAATASPDSSLMGPEAMEANDLPVGEGNPGDGGMGPETTVDSAGMPNTSGDGGIESAPSEDTLGMTDAPGDGGAESEASAERPWMVDAPDGLGTDGAGSNEIASGSPTVLTFEDLFVEPDFSSGMGLVPNGYAGFQWNSAAAVINKESNVGRSTAFGWGTIGVMSLFTRDGADLSFSGPAFDFTGAYVTAVAERPVALLVQAFRGSAIVNSQTVMITPWPNPDTDVPYFYTFNFLNVDSVTFVTGGDQLFVIDNITISKPTGAR